MPQMTLRQNENFVFLNYLGVDYIKDENPEPRAPFTLHAGGQPGQSCNPTVEYWMSEITQDVDVDHGDYILGAEGNTYYKLSGNRPANIKKR